MAVASPELSQMEETIIRRLGVIIKMTSGVVYSIVMHSLIITAYMLVIFQIFYSNVFDLNLLMDVTGLCIFYLILGVVEVALRWSCENPLVVIKSGHVAHMYGSIFLTAFMDSSNPIETILFSFVCLSLVCWTFFVLLASFIPDFIAFQKGIDSLTQPLV